MELQCKAIDYSNPQTLMEWIQAASEMEAHSRLVKSVCQRRSSPLPARKPTAEKQAMKPRPSDPKREQRFKAGRCLTCGGSGHFAAACPSPRPAAGPPKPPSRPPTQRREDTRSSARSALADALEEIQLVEDVNISEQPSFFLIHLPFYNPL